jgi:hypothetical protein
MTIPLATAHLVRQGYRAWLHECSLEPDDKAAELFAQLMTDNDRQRYESLRRDEVERVIKELD